jgi:lysyl-tRNA synthetase class 2
MTNNSSIQEVLFFPQMRPEKKSIELTEEEEIILKSLKEESPIELNVFKSQFDFSNKKWDKSIKNLSKNKIIKITKDDMGLRIQLY